MYKVRKCLSIESRKKKDDLSQYISDFKYAEQKVRWQNLQKNRCMCISSCYKAKDFGGHNYLDADADYSINQLNERMQIYVNDMILQKAKLIMKKLNFDIKDIGSSDVVTFVETKIIGDVSYFELQRQYRKACMETHELKENEKKCFDEIIANNEIIKIECMKFRQKEEFYEKVDSILDYDPEHTIDLSDYGENICDYSVDLESCYESDNEQVYQNIEKWDQFIKLKICIADLNDSELENSILVKREASKSTVYMKYLVLKQKSRSDKITRGIREKLEMFKKREALFIDSFGYSPFGNPVTRYEIEKHACLKEECLVCGYFKKEKQEENQIDSFV